MSERLEELNKDIAVPGKMTTSDGRVWGVTEWRPVAKLGDAVRCTAELVLLKEAEEDESHG